MYYRQDIFTGSRLCPSQRQLAAMEDWVQDKSERKQRRFEEFKEKVQRFWKLYPYLMVLVLIGCAPTKYVVPQDTVTNTSHDHRSIERDSVFIRDSIWVDRWHEGDTVFQNKVIEHWRDRWHNSTDTVIHNDTTTVYKPVEVVKEVKVVPSIYKWCTLLFWLLVVGKIGDKCNKMRPRQLS